MQLYARNRGVHETARRVNERTATAAGTARATQFKREESEEENKQKIEDLYNRLCVRFEVTGTGHS